MGFLINRALILRFPKPTVPTITYDLPLDSKDQKVGAVGKLPSSYLTP